MTLTKPSSLWKIKHETTRTGCYLCTKSKHDVGVRKEGLQRGLLQGYMTNLDSILKNRDITWPTKSI